MEPRASRGLRLQYILGTRRRVRSLNVHISSTRHRHFRLKAEATPPNPPSAGVRRTGPLIAGTRIAPPANRLIAYSWLRLQPERLTVNLSRVRDDAAGRTTQNQRCDQTADHIAVWFQSVAP